jgi:16S rRNA (guanine966-N2)-methyltransferase
VLPEAAVRPTPDRVRETVFNWLAPLLPGAFCLDLFAGSGALGFEALSRGAQHVVMVDQSRAVVALLQEEAKTLEADPAQLSIYQIKAPWQLHRVAHPFDIIFLDPPYDENLLIPSCNYLEDHGYLAASAHIYLESRAAVDPAQLPANWRMIKQQKAGQVFYHLVHRAV